MTNLTNYEVFLLTHEKEVKDYISQNYRMTLVGTFAPCRATEISSGNYPDLFSVGKGSYNDYSECNACENCICYKDDGDCEKIMKKLLDEPYEICDVKAVIRNLYDSPMPKNEALRIVEGILKATERMEEEGV